MTLTPAAAPSLAVQGGDLALVVAAATAAERHGFDTVWSMEFPHRSAIVSLAAMASATRWITVASGVAWAFGRSPLTLATDARSLDDLSGGRFTLGIGTGSPQSMSDWHGVAEPHPVPRVEEYVGLLKAIWRVHEEPVAHEGRFYRVQLPIDPAARPLTGGSLPVLLAGAQPPMLRAAGAVADGLVGHPLFTARYVEDVVRPALAAGAKRGTRPEAVPIAGIVICAVDDDPAAARRAAATQIAAYATRKASDAMLEFNGYSEETAAIRDAFARKDFPTMVAAVSERMLDDLAVYGTADEARQRYRERFEPRYEKPVLYSPNTALPEGYLRDNIAAICETFGVAEG
jgi:alkanesulfonate monooxygenase SsuD/methylene tetrahydromethanopterin reductase-like flavin-dependent oxidoreductase (luciferase family)